MGEFEDKDTGLGILLASENGSLDFAPYSFLEGKKLTKEEMNAPGVVKMLVEDFRALKKECIRLKSTEAAYNDLRVAYAELAEHIRISSRMLVFIDLVLILAPLFLGMIVNFSELLTVKSLLTNVPLVLFIIAALISKYVVLNKCTGAKDSSMEIVK